MRDKEPPVSDGTVEVFGQTWHQESIGDITLIYPQACSHPDIPIYRQLLPGVQAELHQLDGMSVQQHVVLCPPDFYWKRFLEKASRTGFDPSPWFWSEGDVDTTSLGNVFCVKLGAEFQCESERRRFIAHELDHPRINYAAPILNALLSDSEGIVEADARIGLRVQFAEDMADSTRFISSLPADRLIPAGEINRRGYDHPSFLGKKPSESAGYASSLMWFLSLSLIAATSAGATGKSLQDEYVAGRNVLFHVARSSRNVEQYKSGLKRYHIEYDLLASQAEPLIAAQKRFSQGLST